MPAMPSLLGRRPAGMVLESEHRVRADTEATEYLAAVLAAIVHDEALVGQISTERAGQRLCR